MWVQLLSIQYVDDHGQQVKRHPGDWVQVGKQQAKRWIAQRLACVPPGGKPQKRPPREVVKKARAVRKVAESQAVQFERKGTGADAFTIFAVPRQFEGIYKTRQENALNSWQCLRPKPEIVLFCDDAGVAEAAEEFGCVHIPQIDRNGQGTPLINDIFIKAQRYASNDLVCYVNSDIIVYQDLVGSLTRCATRFPEQFLMIGRRWDVDITQPWDFDDGWQDLLWQKVKAEGRQHSIGAIDFFGFWRGLYDSVPPFAVGRSAWDNWLVCQAVYKQVPTIEAQGVTAIHQDMPQKKRAPKPGVQRDAEKLANWELYNERPIQISGSGKHTTWILDKTGRFRKRQAKWMSQI